MKCFTLCFQTSKYKKLQKSRNKSALKGLIHENCEHSQWDKQEKEMQQQEVPIDLIAESSRDEDKIQLNSSCRKKVTINLNAQNHEEVTTESLIKNKDESREEREVEEDAFSDSITIGSSFITYPPNHILDNCTNSNKECEDRKLEGGDLANDANGGGEGDTIGNGEDDQEDVFQEESSSDSLFSISLEPKKQTFVADLEKEVNSPFKKSVHSVVLNTVDGLIQLKAIKTKSTLLPSVNQIRNENVNMETQLCNQPSSKENEVAVDASLSSWLLESEKTSKSKNGAGSSAGDYSSDSVKSSNRVVKHRPILGEIQLSNCSSPRGSRSCGKNETPKLGTIGSYWKHTVQATSDSASSSSCRGPSITSRKWIDQGEVKYNSTPFQNRLEKALESGIAQVQPAHPTLTV